MKKKLECKKILNLNEGIVIVGPAYDNSKIGKKLRVYLNGGAIGAIYVGDRKNGKSELIDKEYIKYSDDKKTFESNIDKEKLTNDDEVMQKLTSKEYIQLCEKALDKKWTKKDEEKTPKERDIETQILRKFMNSNTNWNAIDMEVCFPEKFFENAKFSKGTTKKPRFDIITISKDGIGIIELKVNNENCSNINSHYEHMKYVQEYPCKFKKGILDRIPYLIQNGLLDEEKYKKYEKQIENNNFWFGFLFVGGDKEKSKEIASKLKDKELSGIKFMYCKFEDIDSLNIENMKEFKDFLKI